MRRLTIAVLVLAAAAAARPAAAQSYSARRMGMGGVELAGSAANVAWRAVPPEPSTPRSLSLPIGLLQVLADPPQLNPKNPDFNVFDLANLLYTTPWNLQLTQPDPIASDVTISISQSSLAVDLGSVKDVFPKDHSLIGAVVNAPVDIGVRQFFVGLLPVVQYDNDLSLNPALHDALANGAPFVPNTTYQIFDKARSQAAAGAELGVALPLMQAGGQPADRSGLYVGARLKALRGIAYGDADNQAGFTTGDTLFTNPVDIRYVGLLRQAGPADGGWGAGADLGAVWITHGVELGLGVNDVATRIHWKVRESVVSSDSATGGYTEQIIRDQAPFTSSIPAVVTASAAMHLGRTLLAADVVSGVNNTQGHLGAELWQGAVAYRAGMAIDANHLLEGSCGTGLRFGSFGLDLALASHSRNLQRQRVLELGAGLAFYH